MEHTPATSPRWKRIVPSMITLSVLSIAACVLLPYPTGLEAKFQSDRAAEVSNTYGVRVISYDPWLTTIVIEQNGITETCVFPSEKAVRMQAALNCSNP